MRLLVPAASAALIAAVALSATAAVPAARARSAPVSSAPVSSAQAGTTALTSTDTAAANTTRVAPRGAFAWPLSPRPAVLRRFEQPRNQWSPGHRGVDLLAAVRQPVLSAGDGIVA